MCFSVSIQTNVYYDYDTPKIILLHIIVVVHIQNKIQEAMFNLFLFLFCNITFRRRVERIMSLRY